MRTKTVVWVVIARLDRSGVPVALERMLRWLATQGPGGIECHVIAGRGGPVAKQMSQSVASLIVLEPPIGRSPMASLAAAGALLGAPGPTAWSRDRWYRHRLRGLPPPHVILAQGAGAWEILHSLGPGYDQARLVLHLHELDVALSRSGSAANDSELFTRPDALLAVCQAVADLAARRGAAPTRVCLIPGSVGPPPKGWDHRETQTSSNAVLSMGLGGWRKGTDRAIAAAWELGRTRPEIEWHWVGEAPPSEWAPSVGSPTPLIHHGEHPDPWSVVASPAGLVVTSREDPLPLVALEAAARAIPVVATRTGGLVDLLAAGRGILVPGSDIGSLVNAVTDLVDTPQEAAERANGLRHHVRTHLATDVVGPRWLDAVLDRP